MNIVGEVAEERSLRGNESLAELVKTFRKSEALITPENFPVMNRHFQKQVRDEQRAIEKAFSGMSASRFGGGDTWKNETALIHSYIATEFGGYYDTISPDLFKLEREICTNANVQGKKEEEEVRFRIPLFACAGLTDDSYVRDIFWKEGVEGGNLKEYHFEIKSPVPPFTQRAEQRALEARIRMHEIFAKTLRAGKLGEEFHSRMERTDHSDDNGLFRLALNVYWIPKPSDLKIEGEIIDRDPMLIGEFYGLCSPQIVSYFLIDNWDVKGEEPYQHYLAEFTEKKAGKA